jgi:ribose 1,5-bisphosphokinase
VACNVSRAVIAPLRERYACCDVVLVTAPKDVLSARLAQRRRSSDGNLGRRLARDAPPDRDLRADVVIDNVGSFEQGAAVLEKVLRASRSP